MAVTPLHKYFVYNHKLCPNSEFISSENEGGIYEVLRVNRGVPLFLEEHLARFYLSAELAGKNIRYSEIQIENLLNELIRKNEAFEGNILVSCKTNLKAYFIPHNYPAKEMYQNGVNCGLLKAERENPNAKVFQTSVREKANRLIENNGIYEVLLVDHVERITEGSRSNVFFVKNGELITPPGNEVLLGITRQRTIALARKLNINLKEEDVYLHDLANFQAVVVTGTSPKILPVKQVGSVAFDSQNPVVRKLMNGLDEMISDYVNRKNQR